MQGILGHNAPENTINICSDHFIHLKKNLPYTNKFILTPVLVQIKLLSIGPKKKLHKEFLRSIPGAGNLFKYIAA